MPTAINPTQAQLQMVRGNLERLLRSYQAIKHENEILKSQIDAQRRGLADKNKKIDDLEKQIDLIKTAQNIAQHEPGSEPSPGRTEMKRKINELIRDVDDCIAMLND
ncbi:MAG: hypothetical protein ACHQFW_11055 [Chitinophagales bacterium]